MRVFGYVTVLSLCLMVAPVWAAQDQEVTRDYVQNNKVHRTAQRPVAGMIYYPDWLMEQPEHAAFSPMYSNHDPHHQHPAQWDAQWHTQNWQPERAGWSAEDVVSDLFRQGIFTRRYFVEKDMAPSYRERTWSKKRPVTVVPVLEVGPKFYQVSEFARRRMLDLVTKTTGVFDGGYTAVVLRDWKTKRAVGNYTLEHQLLMD